jgi:ATP-binding cassette subfamily D (ALD) long-chain fatty acid import protein
LLYETCKAKGITVITISTRASLKKYHTHSLTLGLGDEGDSWEFERIGTEKERLGVERELEELRGRLGKVKEWEQRRQEVARELELVQVADGEELPTPGYLDDEHRDEDEVVVA